MIQRHEFTNTVWVKMLRKQVLIQMMFQFKLSPRRDSVF